MQMPSGIPVATVAINGGANAGLLAARMLAISDEALLNRLKDYAQNMKEQVQAKDAELDIKITENRVSYRGGKAHL